MKPVAQEGGAEQGEAKRVVRRDQLRSLQPQVRGLRDVCPHRLPGKQNKEPLKSGKPRGERREPLAFRRPDSVSVAVAGFPGLSLLGETAADSGCNVYSRGCVGWGQAQVSAAQSPHLRMMW